MLSIHQKVVIIKVSLLCCVLTFTKLVVDKSAIKSYTKFVTCPLKIIIVNKTFEGQNIQLHYLVIICGKSFVVILKTCPSKRVEKY